MRFNYRGGRVYRGGASTPGLCGKPARKVIGLDSVNDYYDVSLKEYRLRELAKLPNFTFIKGNLADKKLIDDTFANYQPQIVVNLAAQAGVRYSITNPGAYIEANLIGFYNILEACRHSYDGENPGVEHLVYASSSSMAPTKKCLMQWKIKWITLYPSTRPPRKQTSFWHMPIPNFIISLLRGYVFLPFMGLPDDRIWRTLALPINLSKAKKSKFSTSATVSAILLTWMILWRALSA